MISWWHTDFGLKEKEALLEAYSNRRLTQGEESRRFELEVAEIFNVKEAVVTPSGTAAICMSLIAAGVKPGDEIVLPDFGWIATAQAAKILGAKVILVDTSAEIPSTTAKQVIEKISAKTKIIITMNFHGRDCGTLEIAKNAENRDIILIEDACKAMFCKVNDRYVGTIGFAGCFSMGMISLVSCGHGTTIPDRIPGQISMFCLLFVAYKSMVKPL